MISGDYSRTDGIAIFFSSEQPQRTGDVYMMLKTVGQRENIIDPSQIVFSVATGVCVAVYSPALNTFCEKLLYANMG